MSALVNLGEGTTQASAIETIKELKIPVPPKPPEPPLSWKKNRDGDRTIVLRMPDCDPALQFESGYKQSGLPLQMYVSDLLQKAEHGRITSDVEKFQVLTEETLEYKAKLGLFEAEAKKYAAEVRELREIEAENKQLEKEAQQVEAIASDLVEQFPSTLFFTSLITPTPAVEVPLQQEVSTRFSFLTPPTERYMLGWNPGDQVIANSVVPTFEQWCQGKPVLIKSVQGKVGSVQQLTVVRCDGERRMSFGNWVEEIKSENTTPVEVDYALLSDALKKAASWQEIEQLVEKDSSRLTFAVKEWTPVQKNSLRNLLTSYLESDADALIWHLVDWMPLTSLEKSFKQLFFKVRNIMEGLTAPWLNGFAFVHVDDFGLDTEEWIFIDPASSQNIKVCDRLDFAVQAR